MAKKIFEELPARKHQQAKMSPISKPQGGGNKLSKKDRGNRPIGGSKGGTTPEERISQAASDIRYRARREDIDLRAAYAQYMQNSNLSAPEQAAVREKLFGKDGGDTKKESYDALMSDSATTSVANAMFKVFVEKNQAQEPSSYEEQLEEAAHLNKFNQGERKYKVRVTDPKNDRSYVRYANRQKITELRAKGLKVEMTEYGDPYEGKKKKARLDPVGKVDPNGDIDNDNIPAKKDPNDRYLLKRREAISAAIAKKKNGNVKEEFLADGTVSTEGQNTKSVSSGKVNNYVGPNPVVKVMPTGESDTVKENANQRFLRMVSKIQEESVSQNQQQLFGLALSVKRGEKPRTEVSAEVLKIVDGMSEAEIRKYAKTKHEGLPEKKEVKEDMSCDTPEDKRDVKTYRDVLKNKFRSMGKKDVQMVGDDQMLNKVYDDLTTASFIKSGENGQIEPVHSFKKNKK